MISRLFPIFLAETAV